MESKPSQFVVGTEAGEGAWLIASAVRSLAPLAPVLFGRQGLDGTIHVDFDALLNAASALALKIQDRAFEMTGGNRG